MDDHNRIERLPALMLFAFAATACASEDSPPARTMPAAEIVQGVPDVDASTTALAVVRRSYGEGYVMFELDQALDPQGIDVERTRLMTVRPDDQGELEVIEAAGDVLVDADGRTIAIELADEPRPGEVYRALATVTNDAGELEQIDLGTVLVGDVPDEIPEARARTTFYLPPRLVAPDASDATAALQFAASVPEDGEQGVRRDLLRVTIKYQGAQIDCANPIQGREGFHLYSVEPALFTQQEMYPDMPVGYGPTPKLVCDEARNQISMDLPTGAYLLGGAVFKVETRARAKDGSTLSTVTTFTTRNPGLSIHLTRVTNEIYKCDDKYPFSKSYRCDIYLVSQVKTRVSPTEAWQINTQVPAGGNWANWPEDTSKSFSFPNSISLYKDAVPVGDPVAIEIHAYDADSDSGWKTALAVIGGIGKVVSPFYPPAGPIGEGLTQISQALPAGKDQFQGGGTYFLPKTGRWGTRSKKHVFKLPGRPTDSQIVLDLHVFEYPAPWFAPAFID